MIHDVNDITGRVAEHFMEVAEIVESRPKAELLLSVLASFLVNPLINRVAASASD